MAFKMKGFSYPGKSPVKMVKKGATSNARSKTPGPIVADTRVTSKKKTSKSIGPAESEAMIEKRAMKVFAERKKAQKANPKAFYPESKESKAAEKEYDKAKSFVKMKKSPAKMKKSPAKLKKSPAKKTYDEAFDALPASEKKKYYDKSPTGKAREEFKKAARAYNKQKYGTTEPTKTAKSRNMTKKELAKSRKNVKDYDASNKAINKKAEVNASKKKKNVVTSKVTGKKAIDNRPKSKPTRKRTVVGKIATKAANLVRKNKKDPNRTLDKSNKKAEKKAARVNKKLAKITAKREKISSKKDMTVKQARRANKRSARLAEKANKIQAKAKKKILKK